MNDTIFQTLAILIFLLGLSISIYFRSRAERASDEKISLKDEGLAITIALRVGGLCVWLGVFAYMINPAWMSWARIDLPDWLRWVGVGMGVFSDLLAYWTFSNLGNNVTPTVVTRSTATLVTSGPYRWVRHPLYLMGLIAYLGFALLSENWFIALATVVSFIVMLFRIPKEETRLVDKFGDAYRQYMLRTGRFTPKLG
jgi:protein-S-isoprenylcysteine O-methyltransferase Ste14